MNIVTICNEGRIAIVTIDNPPVNALSQALRQELWGAVDAINNDPTVDAAVLICSGRTFIAGADVSEFSKPALEPHLPDLVSYIESSLKPWTAAIHGSALGGGFEIAMGCRFRVALCNSSLGLPGVNLGLIPGASGTVRTPRLCGISAAVELVTTGKPISADKAKSIGLIDSTTEQDLLTHAINFTNNALSLPLPLSTSQRLITSMPDTFWCELEISIQKTAKGAAAPLEALAAIKRASQLTYNEAMKAEREVFLKLRTSRESAALRHVFFAERSAFKPQHIKHVTPSTINTAAVIGGGTMGVGIAATLIEAGLKVTLIERDVTSLNRALSNLETIFTNSVKRGRFTSGKASVLLNSVNGSCDYGILSNVDLAIEAVFEDISIKKAVFKQLEKHCRADAILATNTSYLNPKIIFEGLNNPERLIGLHFFSPANIMKLLEIIPLPETSDLTLATCFDIAKKLGKTPIEAGICDGFIGNRILKRYRTSAEGLLREGISIADIDFAMREYGFAMGPFEAQDLGGLDIAFLQREAARKSGQITPETLSDILVKAGRMGQKTSKGWYDYMPDNRKPHLSDEVTLLLKDHIKTTAPMTNGEISQYLVTQMAEEGKLILNEGIARKSQDIDLVEIHGYGFPRWRGGPMFASQ